MLTVKMVIFAVLFIITVVTPAPKVAPVEGKISNTSSAKTFTNSIGMEFVLIPAGEFMMGTNCVADDPFTTPNEREKCIKEVGNEYPGHEVAVRSFYMGKYEVTQEQWVKVMGSNPSHFKSDVVGSDSRKYPVDQVSWKEVQEFIKRLNALEKTDKYRLPSEAEWEYAARAGTQTAYSFGDDEAQLGDYAWYDVNSNKKTHPVGEKKPNPWGLYDMHGNVWEWCQDTWHDNYAGAPTDGSAWVTGGEQNKRLLRGGSWSDSSHYCRSASRYWGAYKYDDYGFRLSYSS